MLLRHRCGGGCGFTEAAIHAASEVIERHGIGRFIAQHFFYDSKEPIRKIIDNSMPAHLLNTLRDAETAIGASIEVFDASSQIDYPVFIAYCPEKTIADIHVVGGGCSLYPSHAAARAIKELVQQYKVAEGVQHVTQEWTNSKNNLGKTQSCCAACAWRLGPPSVPKQYLTRCLKTRKNATGATLVPFKNECFKANHPVWLKELHSSPNQVSLACAVMPKWKDFRLFHWAEKLSPAINTSKQQSVSHYLSEPGLL
nr:hypothetical protein [Pseudomonas sp. BIGb0427]